MSYSYYDPAEIFVGFVVVILMCLAAVALIIAIFVPEDQVLSEQLNRYDLDPTIVKIEGAECAVVDDEPTPCTVNIEVPMDLMVKARYIRLIDPEAEVAAAQAALEGEPNEEEFEEEPTED